MKRKASVKGFALGLEPEPINPNSEETEGNHKRITTSYCTIQENECASSSLSNGRQHFLLEKLSTSQKLVASTSQFRNEHEHIASTVKRRREQRTDCDIKKSQIAHFQPSMFGQHNRQPSRCRESSTICSACQYLSPIPSSGFGPIFMLPICQTVYPDPEVIKAHQSTLLPFCSPWFSMPMMTAPSTISMSVSSRQRRAPHYHLHHCFHRSGSKKSLKP
ncbi:uncharacterized protein LOC115094568 [Rhinatrema bivittatum]|uniref:uncharacterized protein LOC115094568 n=1 Tax=Rhinatrema bivittatum TaxID=194408 RepID=UPI001126F030|nr:uncharacterized protein LOC115094568 [Rhinatrema bivittatum]